MNLTKYTHITFNPIPAFFITILLFFGTISISIAEEDTTQAKAIADATSDAKNYNAIFWTSSGVLSIPASLLLVGTMLSGTDVISVPWVCVCWATLPTAVVLSSHFVRVSPPTERLMGKSPEYVSVYVKTYTMLVKRKRQKYVIGGSVAGFLATGGFLVWLFGGL